MVETETCTCQHPYELHDAAQREAALRTALEKIRERSFNADWSKLADTVWEIADEALAAG